MNHLLRISMYLVPLGLSTTLGAATITVTRDLVATPCSVPFHGDCSTQPGAITVDFNSDFNNTPGKYITDIATYVWDTQLPSPIVQGSTPGAYATPGQDLNPTSYLSVGSPGGPSTVTINLSRPIIYFGLYMGSPDAYNSISFFDGDTLIRTLSGNSDALNSSDALLGSWDVTNYINFDIHGGAVDRIVLSSTSPAFETDNHAFLAAPDMPTPEPSTLLTMGIGGILVAAGRARILKRKRTS